VCGDTRFDGFALGIAGQISARYFPKSFKNAGRAGESVLVEIEAEAAAIAEGRVVLLHATDGGGWLRAADFEVSHVHLGREWLPHGP
jgi:hypothetical protein